MARRSVVVNDLKRLEILSRDVEALLPDIAALDKLACYNLQLVALQLRLRILEMTPPSERKGS